MQRWLTGGPCLLPTFLGATPSTASISPLSQATILALDTYMFPLHINCFLFSSFYWTLNVEVAWWDVEISNILIRVIKWCKKVVQQGLKGDFRLKNDGSSSWIFTISENKSILVFRTILKVDFSPFKVKPSARFFSHKVVNLRFIVVGTVMRLVAYRL